MEIQTIPLKKEVPRLHVDPPYCEDPSVQEANEKNRIINGFLRCLKQKDLTIRSELIDDLLKYPDVATDALVIALLSDNRHARAMAAFALAQARHPRIVSILMNATEDECDEVRSWAVRSLGEIGDPSAIHHVMRGLTDESEVVRAEAAYSLGNLGGVTVTDRLFQRILEDPSDRVRMWAGLACIRIEERAHRSREGQNIPPLDRPGFLRLLEMCGVVKCLQGELLKDNPMNAPDTYCLEVASMTMESPLSPVNQPLLQTALLAELPQIVASGSAESETSWYYEDRESETTVGDSYNDLGPVFTSDRMPQNKGPEAAPSVQNGAIAEMQGTEQVSSIPVVDTSCHDTPAGRSSPSSRMASVPASIVESEVQESPSSWLEKARISGDSVIRCQAAVVAGIHEDTPDIPTLLRLMQDLDEGVRMVAKSMFAGIRNKQAIELFLGSGAEKQESEGILKTLISLLSDESEELQVWAVWAMGVLADGSIIGELDRLLQSGSRPVQREIVRSLALLGEPGECLLLNSLHHPDPVVRAEVMAAIYCKGSRVVLSILHMLPGIADAEWRLYSSVLDMLGKSTLPYLYEELETDDELTRFRVAEYLGGMGYEALVPLFEQGKKAGGKKKRGMLRALGFCPDPRAKEPILEGLSDADMEIRLLALRFARNLQVPLSSFLIPWLDQGRDDIRLEAVRILGAEADPRAILPLMKRLKGPSERVRSATIQALEEIADHIPDQAEGWVPPH
jgi:HEAT repeat protein